MQTELHGKIFYSHANVIKFIIVHAKSPTEFWPYSTSTYYVRFRPSIIRFKVEAWSKPNCENDDLHSFAVFEVSLC